jgi:hypothetical protein
MKGCWFIEIDKDILTHNKPIYSQIPQKLTIPLGFDVFDEDDYNLFKTWLDRDIQIPLAGVIVLSELGLQLLKFNIPETLLKDFGELDSPAISQCAVLSYERVFDPDVLFQEIEVNTSSYCYVTSLTGKIKFHSL